VRLTSSWSSAQRGDKRAFELLVTKYQRKLARLLSRFIRDSAEAET
jgi:RNA polymerase sigma-70 factor (ECF subfamily)